MNIFILDKDPIEAAKMQCNKHTVKMILESAQMLCTAHRLLDNSDSLLNAPLYKVAHKNHPCTIWTRESKDNYLWLYNHFIGLCDEYTHRYGKVHLTDTKYRKALKIVPTNIPDIGLTQFRLAMGSNPECQFPSDPVKSYRAFYKTKQSKFKMEWTNRDIPEWFLV